MHFGKRLEPLGATASNETSEDDENLLETSLFALTTHFAQIQFRLKQISTAPLEDKPELIRSLEEFASEGVNNLDLFKYDDSLIEDVKLRRDQQKILLKKLKLQLRDAPWDDLILELKFKQEIEAQLRTQILDLERFIEFLKKKEEHLRRYRYRNCLLDIIDDGFSILQAWFWHRNTAASFKQPKVRKNWNDLKAGLELAIINIKKLVRSRNKTNLTIAVRKSLTCSIRKLMEHGTRPQSMSVSPMKACLKLKRIDRNSHSWEIILDYYKHKNGPRYNQQPVQKLCQSYKLEMCGLHPKDNILSVIGEIIAMHNRYQLGYDSHFKAFICAALNAKKLAHWLSLIFRCSTIVKKHYCDWSYVANTGYRDGIKSLEILAKYKFDLPVDLDVRRFDNDDVFT